MGAGALVLIANSCGVAELAEDDDTGGATINAEGASGADVVVDGEDDMVVRVFAGLFGADRIVDGIGGDHVDALPRADVDAAFAGDAFALIDVDELLGLDRLGKPGRIDLLQDVVGAELRKRWIRIEYAHQTPTLSVTLSAALTMGRP